MAVARSHGDLVLLGNFKTFPCGIKNVETLFESWGTGILFNDCLFIPTIFTSNSNGVFLCVGDVYIYIYVFPMWSSCPRFIVLPGGWPITELGHRSVQSVIAIIASLGRSTWANSRQNSDQS